MKFTRSGLQTSIQDLGRPGLMRYGISRGGAADPLAMKLANLLLGNPQDTPVLEVALVGPDIEFQCDISIAIAGAQFTLTLDGEPAESDQVLQVKRGSHLSFGRLVSGARAYVAFAGRMEVPPVFRSASTHLLSGFGGYRGRAVETGDIIHFRDARTLGFRRLEGQYRLRYTKHPQLRLVAGAEEDHFDRNAIEGFYGQAYQVGAQSNRMGIRLSGGALDCTNQPQIVSSGLCPGTVQIPPDGQPIVSFVEGQTIGGYPRIAHVISADQHLLGQLKANDRVSFTKVSIPQAHEILKGKSTLLGELEAALSEMRFPR